MSDAEEEVDLASNQSLVSKEEEEEKDEEGNVVPKEDTRVWLSKD
jgi:hypothetical protein